MRENALLGLFGSQQSLLALNIRGKMSNMTQQPLHDLQERKENKRKAAARKRSKRKEKKRKELAEKTEALQSVVSEFT